MIYGYARCSTNDTKQDVERQAKDLERLGAQRIYQEYISGTALALPQLEQLKKAIVPGDMLITTEISRLTRSVHQLCHLLEWAAELKIILRVGSLSIDFSRDIEAMTEAMVLMMGVFAQAEQRMTVQRVKSGVAHARAKGKQLGRPSMTKDKLPKEFLKQWPKFKKGQINKAEFAKNIGCSRPTLNKYISLMLQP